MRNGQLLKCRMLKEEKEFFIDSFGNPEILKGVSIVFAFFLFGLFYLYNDIASPIDQKQLIDVYAKHPKIEKGSTTKPSYLTFESASEKKITFRVESRYLKRYDLNYLFSFHKEDKLYQIKVLRTELEHAENGDPLKLYSILDEKSILDEQRSYLTFEDYNESNKTQKSEWIQTCTLLSTVLFVWILLLIIKKKRNTVAKHQAEK